MKFGSEMNDRSIERWKNYNLDYNLLKHNIKLATTSHPKSSSSLSSSNQGSIGTKSVDSSGVQQQAQATLGPHQKRYLKNLYLEFKKQIQYVSLFVNSKYGELSRRSMATKKQLNQMLSSESEDVDVSSAVYTRLRARKFLTIRRQLETVSTDLQDLSRFILLQKIAIRKLFKKFLKHSTYAYKQELIDKISSECLHGDPNSFVNLDLTDAATELTLMFDVIDSYFSDDASFKNGTSIPPPKQLPPSLAKHARETSLDFTPSSLILHSPVRRSSYLSMNSSQPRNIRPSLLESRVTAYDVVRLKKAPVSKLFWVHKDNLNEIRFLLLREFKLISDDTGITGAHEQDTETDNQTIHSKHPSFRLKKTESSLNLEAAHRNDLTTNSQLRSEDLHHRPVQPQTLTTTNLNGNEDDLETFHPSTAVISYWLANVSSPVMTLKRFNNDNGRSFSGTTAVSSSFTSPEALDETDVYPSDVSPEVYYPDASKQQIPLLMAPVGGLRQFTLASMNSSVLLELFSRKVSKEQLVNDWLNADLIGNPKMAQLTLDWCYDKSVLPAAKVKFNRMRFIKLDADNEIECYITLDSDIKSVPLKNGITKCDNVWTKEDEKHADRFPHSILEVRYDSPLRRLSSNVRELMHSHLVYRADGVQFSLNNYLYAKYYMDSVPDDLTLSFIAPWFNILQSRDIRKLPSLHKKSSSNSIHGILLNKDDAQLNAPKQVQHGEGYWNEFDYGSDLEDKDDAFYVYDDSENPQSDRRGNGFTVGLNFLTPDKIESILQFANKVTSAFGRLRHFGFDRNQDNQDADIERNQIVTNQNFAGYDSTRSTHTSHSGSYSESETETDYLTSENEEAPLNRRTSIIEAAVNTNASKGTSSSYRPNELASQVVHDKVLSCLYFIIALVSYLVDGAGIGIVYSVLRNSNKNPDVINNNGIFMLLLFGFLCMGAAMILDIGSICLMMCRYSDPPQSHIVIVWSTFFIVTTLFIIGLTSFF